MTPTSLMVHLTAGADNDSLLKFTAGLATKLRVKRVLGIAACQPLQVIGDSVTYIPGDLYERDLAEIDRQLAEVQGRFRKLVSAPELAVEWRSTVTTRLLADYIVREARSSDLIVTNPEPPASIDSFFDTTRRVAMADLALKAGRPILVVNPSVATPEFGPALIAWKDSREARRAVEDALPLLALAARTVVVEVAAKDEMPDALARLDDVVRWLKEHGIDASPQAVAAAESDAGQIEAVARSLGAGLIVGGAYGHNRLREWVLGGVTRDLLLSPQRCSLVSH